MNEKKFISSWISKLSSDGIKSFPSGFISPENNFTEVKLPAKTLLIGKEFFGKYEIITPDGNPVFHADSYPIAKYILYANRNKPDLILLPTDDTDLKKTLNLYETYLDSLIKEIESDYKKSFPEGKNSKLVVNEIFKQLNLVRV